MMEELKKNLSDSKKRNEENKYIDAIVKKMTDGAKVEFSATELKNEIDERVNELKENLKQRGIGFEAWLKMKKTEEDKFIEDEIKPVAEEQLTRKLVLSEFAKAEKIDLNFEKYQEKAKELMDYMKPQLDQVKNKKQRQEMINNISENALNESYLGEVFGRMMAIAKGENPEIKDHEKEAAETAAKAAAEAAAEIEAEKMADEEPANEENPKEK